MNNLKTGDLVRAVNDKEAKRGAILTFVRYNGIDSDLFYTTEYGYSCFTIDNFEKVRKKIRLG